MNEKTSSRANGRERFFEILFLLITTTSIVSVALIAWFIFSNGVPAIAEVGLGDFLFGTEWAPTHTPPKFGILPMILGSVYVTLGSIIIGVPIGLLTAIYMAFYCPKKIYPILKGGINLLAGIPSVVFGLFAMENIVPMIRDYMGGFGLSMLAAIILLAMMILPTVIGLSESSLRAVPKHYYQGAIALGASHERAIFNVVVPRARSGIMASIIMAVGRSIGETMAVKMIAGNSPIIPTALTDKVRTLTTNIVLEMGYAQGLHREMLIATGVVLFIFILIINLLFSYTSRKSKEGKEEDE